MSTDVVAAPCALPGSRTGLVGAPAHQLAAWVRAGEVTAAEVVDAHLRRIDEVEPGLRALVSVDRDAASSETAGPSSTTGALAGVPVSVKDNLDVRGQPTSSGSLVRDEPATRDAVVVDRLRMAGAVLLGRANMDELALGASTQTSAYGPTRNPVDLRRSPGGSSGGPAASVAALEVTLSVGTDTGGSIREPAAQCGLVGMAPSPGLVPVCGMVPFAPELDRCGPLARNVADAALLLSVLADRPGLAAAGAPPQTRSLAGLRVGLVRELCGRRNQLGVRRRLDHVVETLRAVGAEVVDVSAPAAGRALATYMTVATAAAVPVLERHVRSGLAGAEVQRRYEWGTKLLADRGRLQVASAAQRILAGQVQAALDGCDVLLSPTMPTTAPLLDGSVSREDLSDPLAAPYTDCWTVVANLAGLPAVSVPSGRSRDDGMPVGTMLMAAAGQDARLLQVAAVLEACSVDG